MKFKQATTITTTTTETTKQQHCFEKLKLFIWSFESQKGVITIQRYFVENQNWARSLYKLSLWQ